MFFTLNIYIMKSEKDNNLYSMLCNIQDPRRPQGRMHKYDFAQINKKELIKLFKLQKQKRKIPSRETINRLQYPKGIILNKHNIDNQAVTYHFSFIFNGDEYITNFF